MRCPNCSHEQEEVFKCGQCGIIFHKYNAYQSRRVATKTNKTKPLLIVALIVVTVGVTIAYNLSKSPVATSLDDYAKKYGLEEQDWRKDYWDKN